MTTQRHPVWSVYDLYRTARLNVKYYSAKLHRVELQAFWMDFILALTAPTSAVAGFLFWQYPIGKLTWEYLGYIAAFVAILKPLLGLTKKIKAYEELRSGYRTLEHDLQEISELIVQKGKYDARIQDEYRKALKRKGILVGKEPDCKENKRLKRKCEKEVLNELPVDRFFVPEEQDRD